MDARTLALFFLTPIAAYAATDAQAVALLAKARAAFLENQTHARHWTWTTTTTRELLDKDDKRVQALPSVTVDSPIRSDGKRCNALAAWGDGREVYLGAADADTRCAVEAEVLRPFQLEALLESPNVKIRSRSKGVVTLAIARDPGAEASEDVVRRCIASLEATVRLDPETSFPSHIEVKAVGGGCEQATSLTDHYDGSENRKARTTFRKGSVKTIDYALQHAKSGKKDNDYWAPVHAHSVNPLMAHAANLGYWGRIFPIEAKAARIVIDETTTASELNASSTLTFEDK
jgi:hypothetical protein